MVKGSKLTIVDPAGGSMSERDGAGLLCMYTPRERLSPDARLILLRIVF